MSIAEKLTTIAENEQKVYDAGFNTGKAVGYSDGLGAGLTQGMQDEYDRFWDNFQNYGNKTDYENAFRKWPDACYNPKYPIVTSSGSTRANSMFNQSTITDTRVDITINSVGTTHVFYNAQSLHTIRKLKVNKNVTFANWFTYDSALENIVIDGEIGQNISFADCKKLTHDSLMSIIEHLYNYKADGDTSTHTCTIGSTNLNKLSEAEIAIATEKGWSLN